MLKQRISYEELEKPYKGKSWCLSSAPNKRKCFNGTCGWFLKDEGIEESLLRNEVLVFCDINGQGTKCPNLKTSK